eukprot:scpid31547/ scgid28586/ 
MIISYWVNKLAPRGNMVNCRIGFFDAYPQKLLYNYCRSTSPPPLRVMRRRCQSERWDTLWPSVGKLLQIDALSSTWNMCVIAADRTDNERHTRESLPCPITCTYMYM